MTPLPLGMWVVLGWMAFVMLTGIALLIWGWRTGQFHDIEEPKYRMLEDREPEPWSNHREGGGA
jgi:cbb3-type cytochrome oxidase maturation protein